MRIIRLETVLVLIVLAGAFVTMLVSIVGPDLPSSQTPWPALCILMPVALALISFLEAVPATISIKIDTRMTMWLWCLWFMSALAATAVFAIASHVIIYLLFR